MRADARRDLDLVALDTDGLGAVDEKPAERSLGLEADQQDGRPRVPQPVLEMVPDASGIAHAAGGDDDVKAGQLGDRLALVDRFGEPQLRRVQQPADVDAGSRLDGVLAKNLGGADRERGIEKDRRGRNLAALHQVDQIDDQFLGALHREGRNQQRALAGCGVADFRRQTRAARIAAWSAGRSRSP